MLDAARDDGEVLLVATLIAHVGGDVPAERLLAKIYRAYSESSDFCPDLPAKSRARNCRRAALQNALSMVEAGLKARDCR